MACQCRLLRAGEEALFARVAPDVFDDPIDPAAAARFLADPHHVIAAALEDGVMVGFVSAVHYLHPDEPRPELWINEVSVAPAQRRHGLARALIGLVLQRGEELGCAEAWVLTDRGNQAAMALYSAAGAARSEDTVMFTFRLDGAPAPD
jgi:ribosomal protein S18 acetylase RimI-like enzyme